MFSTYAGNKTLDRWFRGVADAPPTRVFVSLHTGDPGLAGANEVSTANWPAYTRQDPAQGAAIATGFNAAASKAMTNAKQMLFPRHDGVAPVTCSWAAIWDAASGGNCIAKARLVDSSANPATKTFNPDDEAVIYAGELLLEVT